MPQSPAIRDQEVLWDQLMAEVQEMRERASVAQTFHTLMGQHSHIGTPVQYERLFLRSLGGKEEKKHDHRRSTQKSHRRRLSHLRL
jgi:hypothetical protein